MENILAGIWAGTILYKLIFTLALQEHLSNNMGWFVLGSLIDLSPPIVKDPIWMIICIIMFLICTYMYFRQVLKVSDNFFELMDKLKKGSEKH